MATGTPTPDAAGTPDGGDADAGRRVPASIAARMLNELVPGTLTLHFARRDVVLPMMGVDAVRILTAHSRGRSDDLADEVDPASASMLDGWLTVSLDKALAVSWAPGPDAHKAVAAGLAALGTGTAER